jgi:hypothetical protein
LKGVVVVERELALEAADDERDDRNFRAKIALNVPGKS